MDVSSQPDPKAELSAMSAVLEAVEGLSPESVARVLNWVGSSLGIGSSTDGSAAPTDLRRDPGPRVRELTQNELTDPSRGCTDVASFVDASGATSGPSRTMAVAYWFQVVKGLESWGSTELNKELKHQGHGLANVTKTLTDLIQRKPAFVVQLKKSGTSKQARKVYKLTNAGVKEVDAMFDLSNASEKG